MPARIYCTLILSLLYGSGAYVTSCRASLLDPIASRLRFFPNCKSQNSSDFKYFCLESSYLLKEISVLCSQLISQRQINSRKRCLSSIVVTLIITPLWFSQEDHSHVSQATTAIRRILRNTALLPHLIEAQKHWVTVPSRPQSEGSVRNQIKIKNADCCFHHWEPFLRLERGSSEDSHRHRKY